MAAPTSRLLGADEMKAGLYELVFYVGDYFARKSSSQPKVPFLDKVPVRFGIADAAASYHVPLAGFPLVLQHLSRKLTLESLAKTTKTGVICAAFRAEI